MVSRDGLQLATASGDDSGKVWDLATRRCVLTIEQDNEYDATCVVFSPDGQSLLSQRDGCYPKIAGDKPTAVEVWNGNTRLATISAEPWEAEVGPLTPGVHSIIVKAIGPDARRSSRPHTIVVVSSSAASDG